MYMPSDYEGYGRVYLGSAIYNWDENWVSSWYIRSVKCGNLSDLTGLDSGNVVISGIVCVCRI